MKKIIIYSILAIGVIAAIVVVLIKNKQKIEAKNATNIVQVEFPVKVAEVQTKNLVDALSLVGNVIANADVMIASETNGRIIRKYVEVGQYVHAGSPLFDVDNEIKQTQLRIAEANFEKAKKDSSRISFLVAEKSIAESQLDGITLQYKLAQQQLIQARRAVSDTRITAPVSGYIVNRQGDVGMIVNNGTVVANIVDVSRLKVKVMVAEDDIFKLRLGQSVDVSNDNLEGSSVGGVVSSIGVKGDEAHTYPIEIRIDGNTAFKAGMFARVNFKGIAKGSSLVVPRDAIVGSMRDAKVYVASNNKAALRSVVVGKDVEGSIEIVSGVQAGEKVVITGQNTISDGASIKIVP